MFRRTACALGAGAAVVLPVSRAEAAGSRYSLSTYTLASGSHVLQAQAMVTTRDRNGLRDWDSVHSAESAPLWYPSNVCYSQGFVAEMIGSQVIQTEYSSYDSGCQWVMRVIDWYGWTATHSGGAFARFKWKSAATGSSWVAIGDLVPYA